MVSHKHKCIFIHIPKCAGTSFEDLLGHSDDFEGRASQDHRSVRMIQSPVPYITAIKNTENVKDLIRRYREYARKHANPNNALRVNAQQYDEYYKFTIVRNPWHRLHSWYRNVMRDEIHQVNYKVPPNINFEDFVIKYAGTGYLRPQTYWLKDFDGNLNFDHIGKFENLDDSVSEIAKRLNIQEKSLPHKLHSKSAPNLEDFTDKSVTFIQDFYAEEIALFDYSFE